MTNSEARVGSGCPLSFLIVEMCLEAFQVIKQVNVHGYHLSILINFYFLLITSRVYTILHILKLLPWSKTNSQQLFIILGTLIALAVFSKAEVSSNPTPSVQLRLPTNIQSIDIFNLIFLNLLLNPKVYVETPD